MVVPRLSVALLALVSIVSGTQIMRRPDNYKEGPRTTANATTARSLDSGLEKRANGKIQVAYFTNWGIYGRNFQPTDIKPAQLTHILYAFADTDATTGAIKLTDTYADIEKRFPSDSWSETGNNVYGCFKQLYLLKKAQRNLKVLLSIGGWTYSQAGHFNFVTNPTARAKFVADARTLIEDFGLDGIDVDYEYPATAAQYAGFASLLAETRTALNQYASSKGESNPYLLTAAVPAGPTHYSGFDVPKMNSALTFWNLMAYDYSGVWSTVSDDQANVYGGTISGFSTDAALNWYISNGATPSKVALGIPIYGRGFTNTNGIRQPYSGVGTGTWEAGIWDYKALPLAGARVVEDTSLIASYSYDSAKRELISYDTPNIVSAKVKYLNQRGLAGSMFWELSSDKTGSASLVSSAAGGLGRLDTTQNHLNFPNSKYDNIRSQMSGNPPPSGTTTGSGPGPTGGCAGIPAWTASAVFVGGQQATYNGRRWTAKWWTQGDVPGGAAGVWTDNGPC